MPALILLAALAGPTACDKAPEAPPSAEALAARRPADGRLAGLYETSCKACHANPDSGAPLVGFNAAWGPRWAKGQPLLLKHTLEGFNGMPAGGQCFSCTADDYQALIRFMAGQAPGAKPQ
ncbi:c-type cytochrome [Nitrospirillum iridis]|uniref:Cytochrome c5 n=1 Tax=Nitrospirillum iridis TaxID=765888 RepID=A0A7X0B2E2_9PROT|nr:c-type cytochrome [Nitrospirillum iridis]MBB6254450.1 cytochrome c5 [Nitrospirillum iridis]